MTNQHPINPSPELVKQWATECSGIPNIAAEAAQWGADQELNACCEWFVHDRADLTANALREVRRPKLLSLKEQALAILDDCSNRLSGAHENIIRRALEALPNE